MRRSDTSRSSLPVLFTVREAEVESPIATPPASSGTGVGETIGSEGGLLDCAMTALVLQPGLAASRTSSKLALLPASSVSVALLLSGIWSVSTTRYWARASSGPHCDQLTT